jgi:hypothetical protein
LITDLAASLPSFSMPTQSHDSGNHNNGYDYLKTADVRSFADCWKSDYSMTSKLGFDFGIDKNYDF